VRQGHYASEPGIDAIDPPPDPSIERIGDLLDHDLSEFFLPLRQCAPQLEAERGSVGAFVCMKLCEVL